MTSESLGIGTDKYISDRVETIVDLVKDRKYLVMENVAGNSIDLFSVKDCNFFIQLHLITQSTSSKMLVNRLSRFSATVSSR